MKTTKLTKHKIQNGLLFILFTLGPIATLGLMLGVHLSIFAKWTWILVLQSLSSLLFFYPISIYFIISFSLLGFIFIQQYAPAMTQDLMDIIISFITNLENYSAGYDLLKPINSLITWLMLSLLILIISHILLNKTRRLLPIAFVFLSYMIYAWYFYIDRAYYYIILFIGVFLILYCQRSFSDINTGIIKIRGRLNQQSIWQHISLRYVVMILLIAIFLPKGPALLRWSWVETQLIESFPSLETLRKDIQVSRSFSKADPFDFSATGFVNGSGLLGGRVTLDDTLVFTVESPFPLYLRGNILTDYDGRSWQNNNKFKTEQATSTPLKAEHLSGQEISLTITYKNFSSFTLFAPYQPLEVIIERPGKLWIDLNHQLTLLGARYKNDSYTIKAFLPSKEQAIIKTPPNILFNRDNYLVLPETLPQRVVELAYSITKECTSDIQKAQAITDYLRKQYPYTLDGASLPIGDDFVDHFLFESQEGYCTYFASSLAVMLRTLDIPTRYVEGFLMPSKSSNGKYAVRFSNGHAWTEVYIAGSGWLTFEATPTFMGPRGLSNIQTRTDEDKTDPYSIEDEATYLLSLKQNREKNKEKTSLEDDKDSNILTLETTKEWLAKTLPLLILILFIAILPSRYLYVRYKIKQYHQKLMKTDHRILYLYQNILELYAHLGEERLIGETIHAFSKRIKGRIYDFDHDFQALTSKVVHYKYGNQGDPEALYKELVDFHTFIEHRLFYKLGPIKFLQKKYLTAKLYKFYL